MPGSNAPEQHLWQTEATGPLTTAGYAEKDLVDASRPSLSGPYNGPGGPSGMGLGGTPVGAEEHYAAKVAEAKHPPLTPEEMIALADGHIATFQSGTEQAMQTHQSAVEPVLQRESPMNGGEVPDWLQAYMETKPNMGVGMVDSLGNQRYSYERDFLRKLKASQ